MGATESILFQDEEETPASKAPVARRSRPSSRPTTVVRLSGLVLGMSQSGKQTLLARLEGKDPFADESLDDHSERATTVVPYQPPRSAAVWDRIQLAVQVSRAVGTSPVDFCVLLINPTHDRKRIRDYLASTIPALLALQGYDDSESAARPLCLCILLNFRDRQVKQSKRWLELSEVQSLTMQVLSDYPHAVEPSRLVLQCGHTSLFNCYGLDILHHFIYQAYLQRRQSDLEAQLALVHQARSAAPTAAAMEYDDFLAQLHKPPSPAPKTSKATKLSEESSVRETPVPVAAAAEMPRASPPPRRKLLPNVQSPMPMSPSNGQRRATRPSETKITTKATTEAAAAPSPISSKAALEAFLAEESSDEEEKTRRRPNKKTSDDDDDDDDDDEEEFFYDASGRRRHVLSHDSSSDVSDIVEEPAVDKRAKPRAAKATTELTSTPAQKPSSTMKDGVTTKTTLQSEPVATSNGTGQPSTSDHESRNAGSHRPDVDDSSSSERPESRINEHLSSTSGKGTNAAGGEEPRHAKIANGEHTTDSPSVPPTSSKDANGVVNEAIATDKAAKENEIAAEKPAGREEDEAKEESTRSDAMQKPPTTQEKTDIQTTAYEDDSDDSDDEFIIQGSVESAARVQAFVPEITQPHDNGRAPSTTQTKVPGGNEDDEEFYVGDQVTPARLRSPEEPEAPSNSSRVEATRSSPPPIPAATSSGSGGLSSAAMAAIEAARRQAELMLEQADDDGDEDSAHKKSKKKKKPKDEKKKKKKSKRKNGL